MLGHASPELRATLSSDRDFLLGALKDVGSKLLQYASSELCADLGFMLEAANLCPASEVWSYASKELREDMMDDD